MKKVTVLFLALIMSTTLCFVNKAIGQTKTGKAKKELESSRKFKTEREDSLEKVIDLYFRQFQTEQNLHNQTSQQLTQASNEISRLTNLYREKLKEFDTLDNENDKLLDSLDKVLNPDIKPGTKVPDAKLQPDQYTKACSGEPLCVLDELMSLPNEDFSDGSTESMQKLKKYNEMFSRLDARSLALYYTVVNDQMDFISKKDYDEKRLIFAYIIRHLDERKDFILSSYKNYSQYGTKKDILAMFKPTEAIDRYFGQKRKRHSQK